MFILISQVTLYRRLRRLPALIRMNSLVPVADGAAICAFSGRRAVPGPGICDSAGKFLVAMIGQVRDPAQPAWTTLIHIVVSRHGWESAASALKVKKNGSAPRGTLPDNRGRRGGDCASRL